MAGGWLGAALLYGCTEAIEGACGRGKVKKCKVALKLSKEVPVIGEIFSTNCGIFGP